MQFCVGCGKTPQRQSAHLHAHIIKRSLPLSSSMRKKLDYDSGHMPVRLWNDEHDFWSVTTNGLILRLTHFIIYKLGNLTTSLQ